MKKSKYPSVKAFIEQTKALESTTMTMQDIYEMTVNRHSRKTAYIYFDESGVPKRVSYDDFRSRVFKTASKLSKVLSNVPHGAVVALKLKNSPSWGAFFWAILMSGHKPLLIDARLAKENTDNLLRQAKACAIITNVEEDFIVPHYRSNEIFNLPSDYSFSPDWANHVIFCSSGTTGEAKMMVYSGRNLCAQILASLSIPENTLDLMYPGEIRILAMLPFHHIFGFVAVFLWFSFYGKAIVYPSSMSTSDLLYACKRARVSHVFSVPLFWDGIAQALSRKATMQGGAKQDLFSRLIAYNDNKISKKEAGLASRKFVLRAYQRKVLGTHVRFAISGGGFLSPKTAAIINGLGYPLYDGFGMTEVGVTSVEMSPSVEQRLKSSIGKPFYGVEYKIGEKGKTVDANGNASGQLYIKSPITHGKEIIGGVERNTITEDGFFPTGDIASCDAAGSYFLKGRIKDTIILSNGENVYPDEIEYYFKDVKHLTNAVCLGAKLPNESEEKIVLVCEIENTVTKESIKKIYSDIKSINAALPNEKKVQKILIDKRPLPLSGSMKVKRFELKKAIEAGSDDFLDEQEKKPSAISFDGYDDDLVELVLARVSKVFALVLLLPEIKIGPNAIWTSDLGGDSMSYVDMVGKLNEEFHVEIPQELYGMIGTPNAFAKEILDLLSASGRLEELRSPKAEKKARKRGQK
jgi:long-subunit acyl-CoA synthetase (AMP-forming)/acyl carrier protein